VTTLSHPLKWIGLLVLLLTACSPPNDDNDRQTKADISQSQAHYFLESLNLVEQAGRQLQSDDATQTLLEQALSLMDAGMSLAFKVDSAYLNKLDVRLGKNYQRYFVEGVQTYRLGIEAADQDDQKRGLILLSRWAKFWGDSQSVIMQKLDVEK
jgi:hypothetical protein